MNPEENHPRLLISTDHKCDINVALEDTIPGDEISNFDGPL